MLIEFWVSRLADLNCQPASCYHRLHATIILPPRVAYDIHEQIQRGLNRLEKYRKHLQNRLLLIDRSFEREIVEMDKEEKIFFFDNNILLSILYNNTTAREKILQSGSLCINSYGITHRRDSSKRFALFVTRVSEPTTWNLILPTEYRLRSRVNFKIDQVASSLNSKTVLLSDYTNLTNEANYSQFTSMDFISPSHYRIFINSLSLSLGF